MRTGNPFFLYPEHRARLILIIEALLGNTTLCLILNLTLQSWSIEFRCQLPNMRVHGNGLMLVQGEQADARSHLQPPNTRSGVTTRRWIATLSRLKERKSANARLLK